MLEHANGKLALDQAHQHELVKALQEMRGDLIQTQKSASCALGHLEVILKILEEQPS